MNAPSNIAGYDPIATAGSCVWDGEAASKAIKFFPEVLKHGEGKFAGKPFLLSGWQRDYVATLFGWMRPDGTRRFRESLAAIPRKNGKTTLAAGIALYALLCDGEIGAQVYSAAYSRDQASLVYQAAAKMVQQSPALLKRTHIVDSRKRITYQKAGSFYAAISAEASNSHGFNASAVVFDELHTQRTRDLYDVLKTSMGTRRQPLFMSITTAGHNRHSICFEVWKYARGVRDGLISDPYFLPMIYELAEGEDWESPEVWHRCNPNLGESISREFLDEQHQRAKASPSFENTFRNLYLNEWTEQAVRWLPMDRWDNCAGPLPDLANMPCWCGLDMSATRDVTAFVMVFHHEDGYAVIPHFWVPEDTASRREREDGVTYRLWARDGLVTLTPGDAVDHSRVREDILALWKRYDIQEIAVDRWNAQQLMTELAGEGLNIVQFGQGFASMSEPSKLLERLVIDGKLFHGGNVVLRWMASNVAVSRDAAENLKPVKDKSNGRIDGIVAAIMGLGRASTNAPRPRELFLV